MSIHVFRLGSSNTVWVGTFPTQNVQPPPVNKRSTYWWWSPCSPWAGHVMYGVVHRLDFIVVAKAVSNNWCSSAAILQCLLTDSRLIPWQRCGHLFSLLMPRLYQIQRCDWLMFRSKVYYSFPEWLAEQILIVLSLELWISRVAAFDDVWNHGHRKVQLSKLCSHCGISLWCNDQGLWYPHCGKHGGNHRMWSGRAWARLTVSLTHPIRGLSFLYVHHLKKA